MARAVDDLIAHVESHRCFTHPIFRHWAEVNPAPEVIGALFHQIQCFCASTRPGWSFPEALTRLGRKAESALLQEIVDSEEDHGPALATMAGYVVNLRAGEVICDDLNDRVKVEVRLKDASDRILGQLPGYDRPSGLTIQTRKAIAVFDRRKQTDERSTLRNLGTALALEIISNRHLIPGEKHCLLDSGLYGATLEDEEMRYLLEHWGEAGAERQHEANVIEAVNRLLNDDTRSLILEGTNDFLDSLANLWDVLDASLLQSGYKDQFGFGEAA
jgi:hypothetical protein